MFNQKEKIELAEKIEKLILDLKHPEMPTEKPFFELKVKGKENWSFAKIEPNWIFKEGREMKINPFNEHAREILKNEKKKK